MKKLFRLSIYRTYVDKLQVGLPRAKTSTHDSLRCKNKNVVQKTGTDILNTLEKQDQASI